MQCICLTIQSSLTAIWAGLAYIVNGIQPLRGCCDVFLHPPIASVAMDI